MGSNSPNDLPMPTANDTEDSVEIKIKTLDSQTYTLRVNKFVPVPALKEQIATVTGVLSEQQRLICRGRVLRDDQLLSAYHVEDGHTLHLVSRPPMSSSSAPTTGSEGAAGQEGFTSDAQNHGNGISHSFVFEAVNVDQGDRASPSLGRFLSSLLNSIATGNARAEPRETSSETGLSDGTHPQPSSATRVESDSRQSAFRVPSTANLGFQHPPVITDSLTTIHQYLGHMMDEFRRDASGDSGSEVHNNVESSGTRPSSTQGGLPSPASLAEVLLSARDLLAEVAGGSLPQLARQLENQASVTDPVMRTNIQSGAVRSGLLLQNLGSLLLELGRTTMTLRMGQTPSEAGVNAGPAVFISASGPNPLMVQPVPFYPGSRFAGLHAGTANPGSGLDSQPPDNAYVPRHIEIEIHTGRRVSVGTANPGEQANAQQTQEHTDSTRNSSVPNLIAQAISGALGGVALSEEPRVRVVPVRTVVAVPARVGHSVSDPSGRSSGLFVPLFARFEQHTVNDARGSQSTSDPHSGGSENGRQPIHESSMPTADGMPLSMSSAPVVSVMSASTSDSAQYQGASQGFLSSQTPPPSNTGSTPHHEGEQTGQGSVTQALSQFDQWIRNILTGEEGNARGDGQQNPSTNSAAPNQNGTPGNSETQEPSTVDDQAIFFSSLVRQLMPYISQDTNALPSTSTSTTAPSEESPAGPSGSLHDRDDDPEEPSSKRAKRN